MMEQIFLNGLIGINGNLPQNEEKISGFMFLEAPVYSDIYKSADFENINVIKVQ